MSVFGKHDRMKYDITWLQYNMSLILYLMNINNKTRDTFVLHVGRHQTVGPWHDFSFHFLWFRW